MALLVAVRADDDDATPTSQPFARAAVARATRRTPRSRAPPCGRARCPRCRSEGVDLSASPDAYFRWTRTSIEVVGPPSPEPRLGNGHAELVLALPPACDPSMVGYYVFCYPLDLALGPRRPPREHLFAVGGAGAGPRRTALGSTSALPGTASLVDRSSPDIASPFVCASQVPASAGVVRITALHDGSPLEDGRGYVVAVAAYDEVHNVGPLSPLLCGSPQPTDTFMKVYCADGGDGCEGCGICNAGARGRLSWPWLGAAALAAAGVVVRGDRAGTGTGTGTRAGDAPSAGSGSCSRVGVRFVRPMSLPAIASDPGLLPRADLGAVGRPRRRRRRRARRRRLWRRRCRALFTR